MAVDLFNDRMRGLYRRRCASIFQSRRHVRSSKWTSGGHAMVILARSSPRQQRTSYFVGFPMGSSRRRNARNLKDHRKNHRDRTPLGILTRRKRGREEIRSHVAIIIDVSTRRQTNNEIHRSFLSTDNR